MSPGAGGYLFINRVDDVVHGAASLAPSLLLPAALLPPSLLLLPGRATVALSSSLGDRPFLEK